MTYPGNSSLSTEIQNRILTTFEQTLTLAGEGSRQEALLGCDFILRLDPYFAFAQTLQERLGEGEGNVEVDDLRSLLADAVKPSPASFAPEPPAPEAAPEPPAAEGGGDLDALFGEPTEPPPPATPVPEPTPDSSAEPTPDLSAEPTPDLSAEPGDHSLSAAELMDEAVDEMGDEDGGTLHDKGTEHRINELLAEGQAAFDGAEYQTAIDSWSRIFLIDIDHDEANRRIEQARKLKAEVERQVEEIFHEGLTELEAGKLAEAREAFQRVLDKQSNHLAAREYLLKIDSGSLAPPSPTPASKPAESEDLLQVRDESEAGAAPDTAPTAPADAPLSAQALEDPLPEPPEGTSLDAFEVDEPAEEAPPSEWARAAQAGAAPQRKAFKLIAAGVLLVVIVLGWLLYSKWPTLFPNSAAIEAPTPAEIDPIRRALALHEEGQTPIAIAQLRRLPPDHAKHAEAQALIAQWELASQSETEPEGPSEEELEKFLSLIALAERAALSGDNLGAHKLLQEAHALDPLEGEHLTLHDDVQQRLAVVTKELDLFHQGDWEYALRTLWFLREELPENQDVRRLIVDSYYNLGVRDLQRGNPKEAGQKFAEALALAPKEPHLLRLSAFAATYRDRPADLLYHIFVKYLPFR